MPTGKGDLISRKALLDAICGRCNRELEDSPCEPAECPYYQEIVNAPAVEAEPVRHGQWIDCMVRDWRCSECGEAICKVRNVDGYCYDDKPNYCPNCGAKMNLEG